MSSEPKNKMKYVRLGNSGLKISQTILGCLTYGHKDWQDWVLEEKDGALEHFKAAYDLGVNTWDTANVYSNGISEELVGKAVRKYNLPRENLVIMTKLFMLVPPEKQRWFGSVEESEARGLANQEGLNRKTIFASVDASLKRLGMDYIDVLQCHRFDYNTPIEETMQALHDVVKSGKVRYIGMSSCWTYQFHTMQNYAESHGLTKFISMQNYHNALYREEEREMVPYCRQTGVGIIPWSPIARGLLARTAGDLTLRAKTDTTFKMVGLNNPTEHDTAVINAVETVAKRKGISMAQTAVAWSLAQPGITAVIIGSTKLSHLEDTINGIHVKLSDDEIKEISSAYVSRSVVGHT